MEKKKEKNFRLNCHVEAMFWGTEHTKSQNLCKKYLEGKCLLQYIWPQEMNFSD